MAKSTDRNVTAEQEFASLEAILNKTADDAVRCLKLLKKNLSDYDSHHGNHFINTATSYMRSDMRTAKDTATDLKHVAHQIQKSPQPSKSGITSARNTMGAVTKAMDVLSTTARNYDQKKGRSKGVKGAIDNVVGRNDKEKHEKDEGLFGTSEKGKDDESFFDASEANQKDDRHEGGGLLGNNDKDRQRHGRSVISSSDTVEQLVKKTVCDNFSVNALSHQITTAEKSLSSSPSFVERAKGVIHDVKDKLKGDKSSSVHDDHRSTGHALTP